MNRRALLWAAPALALAGAAAAQDHHGGSDSHGYSGLEPGDLGGPFTLRDTSGAVFTEANLRGAWTLLYFGYAACRSSCSAAIPTLADSVDLLQARRLPARAVFVDIDAAPEPIRMRSQASASHGHHGGHARAEEALTQMAAQFRTITFLTGSRAQLRQAKIAFRVRSEHVPARTDLGESGHSINHTSAIYVIDPAGAVVGYRMHSITPADLAAYVTAQAVS
jgi:protein SCO1/2